MRVFIRHNRFNISTRNIITVDDHGNVHEQTDRAMRCIPSAVLEGHESTKVEDLI